MILRFWACISDIMKLHEEYCTVDNKKGRDSGKYGVVLGGRGSRSHACGVIWFVRRTHIYVGW